MIYHLKKDSDLDMWFHRRAC